MAPGRGKDKKGQAEQIDKMIAFIKQTPQRELALKISEEFSELPERYVVLAMPKTKKYGLVAVELIKYFSRQKIPGIYITTNKPMSYLIKHFKDYKLDVSKVAFIDAITIRSGEKEVEGSCYVYIDSPRNLTELNIEVDEGLERVKGEKRFVIVDSLSTLLIYNKETVVHKFIHSLAGKLRANNVMAVMLITADTPKSTINVLAQFCDKTVEI